MKVFAISDLHLSINNPKPMDIFGPVWENYLETLTKDWQDKVQEGDVVLIPGDISWAMKLDDAKKDIKYLSQFNGIKIITRGNHDYWWNSISALRNILPKNFYAIQNDCIKVGKYIFCGTRGWTVPETKKFGEDDKKLYNREVIRLEISLKAAKQLQVNNEEIVCMLHFPPFNSKAKDSDFTKLLEQYGVKKVVYGHLHGKVEGYEKIMCKRDIVYFLTSCDQTGNKLVEIYND